MILLMASAGLRMGALPLLRIKDLESIDKYSLYKIKNKCLRHVKKFKVF